jgi:hypothetical protein
MIQTKKRQKPRSTYPQAVGKSRFPEDYLLRPLCFITTVPRLNIG